MPLTIFGKSSVLDVWQGSEYTSELFNGTLVGHQFFAAQSWVGISDETLLRTTSEVG